MNLVCVCPQYSEARNELLQSLPEGCSLTTHQDLVSLLSGRLQASIEAVARFLARARQIRRRSKVALERANLRIETSNFAAKQAAWRMRGKFACRHGVLFSSIPDGGCRCMQNFHTPSDWSSARFMPSIDTELRSIVVVPFKLDSYVRINTLRSRLRQLDP